jgi:hypothetical protein
MENLQRDYADLIRESGHGRNKTPHQIKSHELALNRKREIDATWKEIQALAPKVSKAQKAVAGKRLSQTRAESEGGYRMYGEGIDNLHTRNPILRKAGRVQINYAKPIIEPHARAAIAYQEAEDRAQNAKGVHWGIPPSRAKTALNAFQAWVRRRRRAA